MGRLPYHPLIVTMLPLLASLGSRPRALLLAILVPGLAMARRPMAMWLFLQLLAQQLAQWYVVARINLPENNCGAMAKGMQWLSLIMGAGPDSTAGRSTLGKPTKCR